jgi:hypothetical protein
MIKGRCFVQNARCRIALAELPAVACWWTTKKNTRRIVIPHSAYPELFVSVVHSYSIAVDVGCGRLFTWEQNLILASDFPSWNLCTAHKLLVCGKSRKGFCTRHEFEQGADSDHVITRAADEQNQPNA